MIVMQIYLSQIDITFLNYLKQINQIMNNEEHRMLPFMFLTFFVFKVFQYLKDFNALNYSLVIR